MLFRLRFLTAGESHGPALAGILEGMPAGLTLDRAALQRDMERRRQGAGRSARMKSEDDVVDIVAGVRRGRTIGSPIAFTIKNRDHARWPSMTPWSDDGDVDPARVHVPRPGHADLAGMQKLAAGDARDVLERASARDTAARTAVGALCRQLLHACGVVVGSHVVRIGPVGAPREATTGAASTAPLAAQRSGATLDAHPARGGGAALDARDGAGVYERADALAARADQSPVRCLDDATAARMVEVIDAARASGDTVGGAFEVRADGLPFGLGHYGQWDRRLTSRIAEALASIPAIREVSFGDVDRIDDGGRAFHDGIAGVHAGERGSNRAGGIEGGMSNAMTLVVRARMKPLATVAGGLPSVDVDTGAPAQGHVERSDTCAVPAASIVAEAMLCIVLADALLEKFGGDTLDQLRKHIAASAAT